MEIRVEDAASWSALQQQVEGHGALMVDWPDEPPTPLQELGITFSAPSGPLCEVTGRVVHVADDGRVALTLLDGKDALLAAEWPAEEAEPQEEEPQDDGDDASERDEVLDRESEAPLWKRYGAMSMREKVKLAKHGNADARRLVMRDRNQALHNYVLENPGLNAVELAGMLKAGKRSGAFVKRVMARTDWMSNSAVVEALVTNPNTPTPIATKLVAKLPVETARRIARRGNLKMPIVQAARKRVITK